MLLLDQGVFLDAYGLNYLAILDIAIDIAKGMEHLHASNMVHSHLKVWMHSRAHNLRLSSNSNFSTCKFSQSGNVMLCSCDFNDCGIMAKVADFGIGDLRRAKKVRESLICRLI